MFASFIILVRNHLGTAKFNQLRGKLISMHAKLITKFCDRCHLDSTTRQYLIRLARDNGKRLGLLA